MSDSLRSFLLFLILLLGLAIMLLLMLRRGRTSIQRFQKVAIIFVAVVGLLLNAQAYLPEQPSPFSYALTLLRSILSTMRMFVLRDDYKEIISAQPMLEQNLIFQFTYWFTQALALFVSASAVVWFAGNRVVQWIRIRFTKIGTLYVIAGLTPQTLEIGVNLLRKDRRERQVLYLLPAVDKASKETLEGMEAMMVAAPEMGWGTLSDRTLRAAALRKTRRISRIHFFAATESEATNCNLAQCALTYARKISLPPGSFFTHVHASDVRMVDRLEEMEKDMENPYDITAYNTGYLAAQQLMSLAPPCREVPFVNGYSQANLNILLIGFGKLGREVLGQLLPNAVFEGGHTCITVIDKDAERKSGRYRMRAPALTAFFDIQFKTMDVNSQEFEWFLMENQPSINYIVVALEDDEADVQLAHDLAEYFRSARDASLPLPLIASHCADGARTYGKMDRIVWFGAEHELLKEEMLIAEQLDAMAYAVHECYRASHPEMDIKPWHLIPEREKQSSRSSAQGAQNHLWAAGLALASPEKGRGMTREEYMAHIQPYLPALGRNEHHRWNAFYVVNGYQTMSEEEMRKIGKRKDADRKRHICLVPFDELDAVSDAYNAMTDEEEDYAQLDRNMVLAIWDTIAALPEPHKMNIVPRDSTGFHGQ